MIRRIDRAGAGWIGVVLLLALLLSACGGGGPSSGASTGSAGGQSSGASTGSAGGQTDGSSAPSDGGTGAIPGGGDTSVSNQPGGPVGGGVSGPVVIGRVVDAAGQPIAGVLVAPESTAQPPLPIPEIALYTDEQGEFQWPLAPGPYNLTFIAEGYARTTQPVDVGTEPITIEVTLSR